MEDDYQQPHEKSIWRKIGDFALNALIAVAAILAVVSLTAVFSDTVSKKLDKWTEDKDGKGGWGSWLRQKAGVSTEQETSATEKLSQMTDKAINKGKELYNKGKNLFSSNTPAENQGATPPANNPPANDSPAADKQKEGLGISDAGTAALLLYGGKKAYDKLNPRVYVDEAGNIHSVTADQVKAEKAVAQATKDIDEARRIQKEAQLKADSLKASKIMEDEANKTRKLYKFQLPKKTANTEYNNAMKALEKANSSVTNLTTVIEEGNKVISTGQPSNNSRLRAYMGKLFGGGAGASVTGETEFGTIEPTTAKPAAGASAAAPATPATNTVKVPGMGDISATPQSSATAVSTTAESITVQKPAIDVEKSTEYGHITANNSNTSKPLGVQAGAAPATQTTINISSTSIEKPPAPPTGTTGETTTALTKNGIFSSVTNGIKGVFAPLSPIIEPITPALQTAGKWLGYTGAVATATEGGIHAKDLWQQKDKDGDFTSRDSAIAQGMGTTMEAGGLAASTFKRTPAGFLVGTAFKDITYTANVIGTDNNTELTKSSAASLTEWVARKIGADKPVGYILDKTIGEKYDSEKDAINRQKKNIEDDKAAAEIIKSLSAEQQLIIKQWQDKANEEGLYKINPLALIEHVGERGWKPPPQTPRESLPPRDTQKQ